LPVRPPAESRRLCRGRGGRAQGGAGHAADRFCRARHLLGGVRPLRRLLGVLPRPLGHGRRRARPPGGGREGHGPSRASLRPGIAGSRRQQRAHPLAPGRDRRHPPARTSAMTATVVVADAVLGAPTPGDAVVIEDGRVVAVTWRDQVGTDPTYRHDGAVILPGLIDSHLHPLGYTALVTGTSVNRAADVGELQEMLAEAAAALPAGGALVAQRLDDTRLGRLPTRHDLDRAVADRPVLVYRYCGHVAVANTAALAAAGVSSGTSDPTGGSFGRDSEGAPTGVLRETAIDVVSRALDPLIPPPRPDQVLAAMDALAAVGIVRIGAMVSVGRPLWAGVG